MVFACYVGLLALGIARIVAGIVAGRRVDLVIVLTLAALVAVGLSVWRLFERAPSLSRRGLRAIQLLRREHRLALSSDSDPDPTTQATVAAVLLRGLARHPDDNIRAAVRISAGPAVVLEPYGLGGVDVLGPIGSGSGDAGGSADGGGDAGGGGG